MNLRFRLTTLPWLIIPLLAAVFLLGTDAVRLRRLTAVTNLANDPLSVDAASATGFAGGLRRLIVPGQSNDSYQFIARTQR